MNIYVAHVKRQQMSRDYSFSSIENLFFDIGHKKSFFSNVVCRHIVWLDVHVKEESGFFLYFETCFQTIGSYALGNQIGFQILIAIFFDLLLLPFLMQRQIEGERD
jgi:hypothetical protein